MPRLSPVESVKTPHRRTSRGCLFRGGYRREAATLSCILAEIQRQAEEQKALSRGDREGSRCALTGGCSPGEAGGSLIRS